MLSDEEEDIVDLMGRTLKDNGKIIDKSADTRLERIMEKRDLRKPLKISKKDEQKRKNKAIDEATEVSTSLAHGSWHMLDLTPI